jgi:hypothetical protein
MNKTVIGILLVLICVLTLNNLGFLPTGLGNSDSSYTVQPVAIAPLTNHNYSIYGLEVPATPSPVGDNFMVYLHLKTATGVSGVDVHFFFGNILAYATPTGFTDFLGTGGEAGVPGVLTGPQSNLLYGVTAGFYDASGNGPLGAPYTGAVYYNVSAVSTGATQDVTDALIAKVAFTIIAQPTTDVGDKFLPLVFDYTDIVATSTKGADVQGMLTLDSIDRGPRMDSLQFKFYNSQDDLFNGLMSNEIDFMGQALTQGEYQAALNDPNIQLFPTYTAQEFEIAFNNNITDGVQMDRRSPMNYTDFRNALNCLVDKQGVIAGPILNGFATQCDTQVPDPLMGDYVDRRVSGANYPWKFDVTHALQILYDGGWYNHDFYPTFADLITAYGGGTGALSTAGGTDHGVVYSGNDPNGQWGGNDPQATANAALANQPLAALVGYVRTNDGRIDLGYFFCNELKAIGCPYVKNDEPTLTALRPFVIDAQLYDFATLGYGMSSPPNWWYSECTPVGISPGGSNCYLIQDWNITQYATAAFTDPTLAQYMVDEKEVQYILVWESYFVPCYDPVTYFAYRTGWLDVVATRGYGLQDMLNYFMLAALNPSATVANTIRYGTCGTAFVPPQPDMINPIFSSTTQDYEVIDRMFTGFMTTNPSSSEMSGSGKSPAGGDMPWMAYDWKWQLSDFTGGGGQGDPGTSYTQCANVTLWFRHDITWQDGVPLTVDDLNYTIFIQKAYGDSWGHSDMIHVINFVKIDDWTCSVYFDDPSYNRLYSLGYDVVPQHIYKYIAIPPDAASGTSTTGLHGEWPGKDAQEILAGAPFTLWDLQNKPETTLVGTGMWKYRPGTYVGGVGGGITLDANRAFFLCTPPLGEVDFNYYWNPGAPPQDGYYEIDSADSALISKALGSVGNPPSDNWNPACDIAAPSCSVTKADLLTSNLGRQWGYTVRACLSVVPASVSVTVGQEFTVDVDLDDAKNLFAYEFSLSFDKSVLNVVSVEYTHSPLGTGDDTVTSYTEIHNAEGYVSMAVSRVVLPGVTGGGVLATIRFRAVASGASPIHVYDTILQDHAEYLVDHGTQDGQVTVVTTNLVVQSVTVVNQGCKVYADDRDSYNNPYYVPVQVTVKNVGVGGAGPFDVCLKACWIEGNLWESYVTLRVSGLATGEDVVLTFGWHPLHTGSYNLTAFADCNNEVTETDEGDNTLTSLNYPVALMGDLDGSRRNDISDVAQVCLAWHSHPGDSNWNLLVDLNHDGYINIEDIVRITLRWHQTW